MGDFVCLNLEDTIGYYQTLPLPLLSPTGGASVQSSKSVSVDQKTIVQGSAGSITAGAPSTGIVVGAPSPGVVVQTSAPSAGVIVEAGTQTSKATVAAGTAVVDTAAPAVGAVVDTGTQVVGAAVQAGATGLAAAKSSIVKAGDIAGRSLFPTETCLR